MEWPETIAGFEWDDGNWPKCAKHGVSQAEIEHVIAHAAFVVDDPNPVEKRLRTAAKTPACRFVFVAFTFRKTAGKTLIRPISARYMHEKEIANYEEAMAKIDQ